MHVRNSHDEWVAGLDVEYTTVVGREKDLKDKERKKPTVIQVSPGRIPEEGAMVIASC